MLNVDYKICSRALSLRLPKVLDTIVDPDQTCSVPGRSISSNLVLLRDTLEYIERTNETGILVSLDQEKAFDRVDRVFLMNLLRHFGFGPSFCNWISTLYSGANMRIFVNGWLSDKVGGRRGGLMVSALDSGANGPGSSPGRGHCVVFLGKTLNSHSASLHPGV